MIVEARHTLVDTLEALRKWIHRDVKTVAGKHWPVSIPNLSESLLASCIWYFGTVATGGLELTGGMDDPDEDYVEEEIYRCIDEHYRRVREGDQIEGTQPKRSDKSPKVVALFKFEDSVFKTLMQCIYIGEPYEADELSDETLATGLPFII